MNVLYFTNASRSFFILTFMENFRPALPSEALPKTTECLLVDLPFKIIEYKNSFIADIYGTRGRFKSIWGMADWIYKKLRKGRYYQEE